MSEHSAEKDTGLDRLRKLNELAAPGPWRVRLFNGEYQVVDADGDVIVIGEDGPELDLIAAMRNALPTLLTTVLSGAPMPDAEKDAPDERDDYEALAEIVRVLGLHSKKQPLIGYTDWRCWYCDWTGPEDEYDLHVATALVAAGIGVIPSNEPQSTRVLPPEVTQS